MATARLITVDAGTVEITHEALLHAWPRLRGWINQDRAGLLLAQQLTEAATTWERERRDHSLLYRGSRLAALTVLACSAAVVAFQQRSTAREQRDRAVSEQVLTEADQVRDRDPSLAAQLTLAAYRIRPSQRAATGLLDTQNVPLSTPLAGHTEPVYAVAFSPDGRTLASTAGDDRTVCLSTMDIGRAIQHVCAATSNTLTTPLWRRYVTGMPFTPPCAQSPPPPRTPNAMNTGSLADWGRPVTGPCSG